VANRSELRTKIVWEISRPDGTHFEERPLEPFLNRSIVSFKDRSRSTMRLNLLYGTLPVLARQRSIASQAPRESQTTASAMK
jgi:hypothetical protein